MTPKERELLENVLDSLDRLFDRRIGVIDVCALVQATAEALRDTPHQSALEELGPAGEPQFG